METDEVITLLTAVGGFITALAALFTIGEMRRQRRSTYRPDLLLRSAHFDVYDRHPAGMDRFTLTTDRTIPFDETAWIKSASCQLFNAGFGPARHVKLTWKLNAPRFVDLVNSVCPPESLQLALQSSGNIEIARPSGGEGLRAIAREHAVEVLVIPAQQAEEVPIPLAFVDLIARYLGAVSTAASLSDDKWRNVPPFRLAVAFQDLEGSRQSRDFLITPIVDTIRAFGSGPAPTLAIAEGRFDVGEA